MMSIRPTASKPARSSLPRLFAVVALVIGVAVLAACSTTEGFGEDVGKLGNNIENSAARNK
ncbi:MAG: hypothetical protein AABZ53_04990 [Planctomycetota bacterium]